MKSPDRIQKKRSRFAIIRKRLLVAFAITGLVYLAAAVVLVLAGLDDDLAPADVALVLGNKVDAKGVPSERLAARLDRAVSLYHEGMFGSIIVSGGTGIEGYPEGDAMRDYLVSKGIPESAIIVDNLGIDTGASARNTAAILASKQWESVFVISQYFHLPRSRTALRKEGVERISSSHARYFEWRDLYSIGREVPAYVAYSLR